MSQAPFKPPFRVSSSSSDAHVSERHVEVNRHFAHLRSVQWRINLGILPPPPPSSSSSFIDDHRRLTADSRRRYAGLRRRLLFDPHFPKDGSSSSDLVMDNPLSQNPDSTWARFFRNAELEKMVDQDLSSLYPEYGSFFQTPGCQGMLRRILLLWCLRHPEYGYRQGMHELLAPILHVLQADTEHLLQVRKLYEDHFTDKFDGPSFNEYDFSYNFDLRNFPDSMDQDENRSHGNLTKFKSLDELEPEIKTTVLLSDAYGAEGELGIVLSERFMEHDAYFMFNALMSGSSSGSVSMADFFSPTPLNGSLPGFPPILEASASLYPLLSFVDSSLHNHLVKLGVEPQYFAIRWLRVLFGREFSLEDLLIIWDEIFASENGKLDLGSSLNSPRGAFISAMAVSMLVYLRSYLLVTEDATSCLQRLLNFPEKVNLKKLIENAKSLQAITLNANLSSSGYWEEKWKVLHMAEELGKAYIKKTVTTPKRGWIEKLINLFRTRSSPAKDLNGRIKDSKSFLRRSLVEDLSQQLGSDENIEKEITCSAKESWLSGNTGTGSEENSSMFSDPMSSVGSKLYLKENDVHSMTIPDELPLPVSDHPKDICQKSGCDNGSTATGLRDRESLSGLEIWVECRWWGYI